MSIVDIVKIVFGIIVVSGIVYAFTNSLKRFFQVAGGLAALSAFNNLVDFGIWPVVQGMFGAYGVVGLILMATVLNFLVLRLYQKTSNTDWLGITVVDDVVRKADEMQGVYHGSSRSRKAVYAFPYLGLMVAKKIIEGRWVPILVLTVFIDSFVATAFHLHSRNRGAHHVMRREDYVFFVVCTVVSCLAWTAFPQWITLPAFKNSWEPVP